MSYDNNGAHRQAPSKLVPIIIGAVVVAVLIVCGVSILSFGSNTRKESAAPTWVTPSPYGTPPSRGVVPSSGPKPTFNKAAPTKTTAKPTRKPAPTIDDELVKVGRDVPAGTYRLREKVVMEDMCYWIKSRDSEGTNIIQNSFGEAGRLEVTLRKGQWFRSQMCGVWERQ